MTVTTEVDQRDRRARRRPLGLVSLAAPLVLVVALVGCGDDGGADDGEAVEIRPTSYVTQPVTATSSTVATTGPGGSLPEGHVPGTQDYEIQPGDFLSAIASDFDVELTAICEVNNWDECEEHLLIPGESIRIPPGARDAAEVEAEAEADADEDPDDGDASSETDSTEEDGVASGDGELCPDGSERGTYTIEEGDYPGLVAGRLDVTVEQLAAANADNSAYRSFIVGSEINLPCEDEDDDNN